MKQLFLFSALLFCLSACLLTQSSPEKLNKEARKAAFSFIQTYFDEDCSTFFSTLSDSLLIMDGDGIFAKEGKQEDLCNSMGKAIRDKEKTFQDYVNTYQVELLSRTELEQKFKMELPDYYKTTEKDVFFVGFELKEGQPKASNFIWEDLFVFMLRKEKGQWWVKGLSG